MARAERISMCWSADVNTDQWMKVQTVTLVHIFLNECKQWMFDVDKIQAEV